VPAASDLIQDQNLNSQKIKFESLGKNQEKFEHVLLPGNKHEQQQQQQQQQTRYDQNLTGKYESQQQTGKHDSISNQTKIQHEQHLHKYEHGCQNSQQYGKHEQSQQQQHEGRSSNKYDHNSTQFKHDSSNTGQYKAEYKSESNKYESGQNKFEVSTKYEQNSTVKHGVDHVAVKFEIPVKERTFEFDGRSAMKSSDGDKKNFNESRIEDKTKPALPPKPSKPNPPPRLTHHEKIDTILSEGINDVKMTNVNLNTRFVCA